ncbi:MAG TPA: pitrilysin family protein [Bacteroidia bacterium]|nr:pitrilysin family protein [Bacteroidia bacterium]
MKNILAFTLTAFVLTATAQTNLPGKNLDNITIRKNEVKLVETVEKKSNDEIVIPYKKYILSNGMTLIIHEDHSDPIIYLDVTYHVGSNREQQGRSGFAHFFEHMMFQGSKHIADEQHFKVVTESGGTLNGSTNSDRTNYFEVLPSNQLEVGLWLESDRMGFLLDSVTQAKFEVQRATVKNERGQNYDNRPYGLVQEKIGEAVFPQGHPYSWSTIGYIEDLNRVDVNDLKRFYLRWYGPNNATLTLAGDVTAEQAIPLIEKYFGVIPKGPEVKPMKLAPAVLTENRYISYEDNIKYPMLVLVWPTVQAYHPESTALTALAEMISGSKSSVMQQMLIKNKKAVSSSAFDYERELAGLFILQIRANKEDSLSKMEKQVNDLFIEFEKKGITEQQLAAFKASAKSSLISSLSTVREKGATLAEYQTLAGNADLIKKQIERINKLAVADIMNAYSKYIKNKPHVVLSVVPKGKPELRAKEDSWKMYQRTIEQESAEYKGLTYNPLPEGFDRSKKPASGPSPVVNVPVYWQDKFENGIKFIGTVSNEIPKVSIQISIAAGHRFGTADKAGLAYMTADLLNESTQLHTPEEISDMLDALGSSIDVNAGVDEINLSISTLTENIDKTLAIAEEILFKPKLSREDFDRVKKQQLDAIQQQLANAGAIANMNFMRLLYGSGHVMSMPPIGTAETVGKLTLEDVQAYYKKFFSPAATKVMLVGNLTQQQLMPKMQFLAKWTGAKVEHPSEPTPPSIAKTMIYFIDKKGAPQSEIRIGNLSMPYDATGDYYKSSIMNFPFGASFNGRINLLIREKHGFSYGVRGNFNGGAWDGTYTMSGGVRANATDSSVTDFMTEFKKYSDAGMTADELTFTKSSLGQADALKYESPFQKAGFLKRLLDYNLDGNYVKQQNQILQSITLAELNALAKKKLNYNNVNILIVGDKATNLEKIKKLGYDVKVLDLNGNEVKE